MTWQYRSCRRGGRYQELDAGFARLLGVGTTQPDHVGGNGARGTIAQDQPQVLSRGKGEGRLETHAVKRHVHAVRNIIDRVVLKEEGHPNLGGPSLRSAAGFQQIGHCYEVRLLPQMGAIKRVDEPAACLVPDPNAHGAPVVRDQHSQLTRGRIASIPLPPAGHFVGRGAAISILRASR